MARSIGRRLVRLEERTPEASPEGRENAIERETLRRMTDAELDAYEAALRREAGEKATDEDKAILARVEHISEEVRLEQLV